jgi:hypothetical protein
MESDVFIAAYSGLASITDRANRLNRGPVDTGTTINAINKIGIEPHRRLEEESRPRCDLHHNQGRDIDTNIADSVN